MFVLVIPLTLVVLLGLSSENFPEKGRNCLCEEARKLVINQVLGERVAMAKAKKKKKGEQRKLNNCKKDNNGMWDRK